MSVPQGSSRWIETLPRWLASTVGVAVGAEERTDPVRPRTGGPAGNARLTAWTACILFVLLAAEGLTLLDMRGPITWHVALGAALIPPVILKVSSTGWRMVSYYAASRPYREAGPPPLLLRMLGPLVVLSTVVLLGTGVVLVLLGPVRSRSTLAGVGGFQIDWVWLHQASFVVWFAAMALHVLGRLIPTVRLMRQEVDRPRAVPGAGARIGILALVAVLGALCAFLLVGADSRWAHEAFRHPH